MFWTSGTLSSNTLHFVIDQGGPHTMRPQIKFCLLLKMQIRATSGDMRAVSSCFSSKKSSSTTVLLQEKDKMFESSKKEWNGAVGQIFVRFAGILGALAVALGAYGDHIFDHESVPDELKKVYYIANRYHMLHCLALMAVPITRRPILTGTLFLIGLLIFSGSCYIHAFTGWGSIRVITPVGGSTLLLAWASMIF
ncbi:hypothetical protein CHUAL_011336 [Chamberlinius hualienensis]